MSPPQVYRLPKRQETFTHGDTVSTLQKIRQVTDEAERIDAFAVTPESRDKLRTMPVVEALLQLADVVEGLR